MTARTDDQTTKIRQKQPSKHTKSCSPSRHVTQAQTHLLTPSSLSYWAAIILLHFFCPLWSPTLFSFRLNKCNLAGKQLWIQMLSLSHSLILHYPSCTTSPPSPTFAPPPSHPLCLWQTTSAAAPFPSLIQQHSFIPLPTMKAESCSSSLVNTPFSFRGWPLLNHCTILITLLSLLLHNLWKRKQDNGWGSNLS